MNLDAISVDASVAVKWVITVENLSDHAQALLRDCTRTGRRVIAPPHMAGEVANALYQKVRSRDPNRHLTVDEALEALTAFTAVNVQSYFPTGLYERALAFAAAHGLPSLYDSLYVVLAQLLGVELWTADRRLLDALGGSSPWVRFIGDYPLS